MGACTFTRASGSSADEAESVYEGYRVVRGTITFSNAYANPAGDTLPLASIGLQEVRRILVDPLLGFNTAGLSIALGGTPSAPTVTAFETNNTQVVNATDLSARTPVPVWLLGSG